MILNRRKFITKSFGAAAIGYLNTLPIGASAGDVTSIVILHTNDVHSRIDAFPDDGSRNANQGGVAKRAALIDDIRQKNKNVLLFDAGDVFQGTPYFNMFGGELEIKLMSKLKYDAGTMGNHDFDAGIDGFEKQLPHANFPFIVSNYDFRNTILDGKVKQNKVFQVEDVKIGVYGLGIELNGLVPQSLYKETQYLDPISIANSQEQQLLDQGCDYIICLSHLGYRYRDEKVSDMVLAQNTSHTDLIIGGHTHTFMMEPVFEKNKIGEVVTINQVGFAGILMGFVELTFEKGRKRKGFQSSNMKVG